MASTITPLLSHSPLLNLFKLNASFNGKTVTHVTQKSDLEAKQRRVEVKTVWKTEDKLGVGAFGVVWRQRAESGKLRAVKIIPKSQLNIQEVEALIELQDHPDLFILFFGWFEDPDRDAIHIAMEYIEHGDLGHYMAGNQSEVDTKEITSQILEGLVVMHEREICHRDLKPQNILIASLSPIWVKITDFGISKRWVGTSLQTNCGTNIYRSPEQLGILPRELRAMGNSYTNHIDIWALGAIVHQMLTLEIPFRDTYTYDDPDMGSIPTPDDAVDMDLLYGYCRNLNEFPCGSLRKHGVSEDGIEFVKSLMVVNPSERATAAAALGSRWLLRVDSPPQVASSRPMPTSIPPAPNHRRSISPFGAGENLLRADTAAITLGQPSGQSTEVRKTPEDLHSSRRDHSPPFQPQEFVSYAPTESRETMATAAAPQPDNDALRVLQPPSTLIERETLDDRQRYIESGEGLLPNPLDFVAPRADLELPRAPQTARYTEITDATYVSKEVEYPPLQAHRRLDVVDVDKIPVETLGDLPNQSRVRRLAAEFKGLAGEMGEMTSIQAV